MGKMVFDGMEFGAELLGGKGSLQFFAEAGGFAEVADLVQEKGWGWPLGKDITDAAEEIDVGFAIGGDVRDVFEAGASFGKTILNGLGREAGPVFDASK